MAKKVEMEFDVLVKKDLKSTRFPIAGMNGLKPGILAMMKEPTSNGI